MNTKQDVDALGKNRDKASEKQDFAKKQSQAEPAAENLDMTPNSVAKKNSEDAENNKTKEQAENYADKEHDKAAQWEDHSATEKDKNKKN